MRDSNSCCLKSIAVHAPNRLHVKSQITCRYKSEKGVSASFYETAAFLRHRFLQCAQDMDFCVGREGGTVVEWGEANTRNHSAPRNNSIKSSICFHC